MLDQPVPNPLAQNPKFNTHKVFAAIGLILIVTVAVLAGIWYFVQSAEDKAGTDNDTLVTKIATSSTKTVTKSAEKDETTDWKTYSVVHEGFSIKYPSALINVFNYSDVGVNEHHFSNYGDVDSGPSACSEGPGKDKEDCYIITLVNRPNSEVSTDTDFSVGSSKTSNGFTYWRLADISYNDHTWTAIYSHTSLDWSIYTLSTSTGSRSHSLTVTSRNKNLVDSNEKTLEKMVSTFKFL